MCKCSDCKRSTPVRLGEEYQPSPRVYRIIRFRQTGTHRTIRSGLTLAEAQGWCNREDTHGPGWFDGYDYMRGCRPREGD